MQSLKDRFSKFREHVADFKIITANLVVLIKTAFLGLLAAEVWRLSVLSAGDINKWIDKGNYEYKVLLACLVYLLTLVLYLKIRGVFKDSYQILKSWRFDILFALLFGIWLSIAWSSFFSSWYSDVIVSFTVTQRLTVLFIPFLLSFLILARQMFWKESKTESSFIVDRELTDTKDDLLRFKEKANRFAERIFNGGSPDSFVFGVDAPWGIGKSSFMNFCLQYWKEKHNEKTVVYKFTPLRYAGADNLLEIFIDGLTHAIQKDSFVPEIKPLISRYSRLLKEVGPDPKFLTPILYT
jgi:hypothetical protein